MIQNRTSLCLFFALCFCSSIVAMPPKRAAAAEMEVALPATAAMYMPTRAVSHFTNRKLREATENLELFAQAAQRHPRRHTPAHKLEQQELRSVTTFRCIHALGIPITLQQHLHSTYRQFLYCIISSGVALEPTKYAQALYQTFGSSEHEEALQTIFIHKRQFLAEFFGTGNMSLEDFEKTEHPYYRNCLIDLTIKEREYQEHCRKSVRKLWLFKPTTVAVGPVCFAQIDTSPECHYTNPVLQETIDELAAFEKELDEQGKDFYLKPGERRKLRHQIVSDGIDILFASDIPEEDLLPAYRNFLFFIILVNGVRRPEKYAKILYEKLNEPHCVENVRAIFAHKDKLLRRLLGGDTSAQYHYAVYNMMRYEKLAQDRKQL